MPGKAPVEKVGGSRDSGPWPEKVAEIVEGEKYRRPVVLDDDTEQEMDVTVTGVNDILADDGTTVGRSVSYTFTDPTLGGGE